MSDVKPSIDKYKVTFLMDFYGDLLSERTRDLMRLSMDEDMSLGEIAELRGISRQAVHDAIRRGEENLLRYEEQLGLCSKALLGRQLITRIRSLTEGFTADMAKQHELSGILDELDSLL